MTPATPTPNEQARLEILRRYNVLDSEPDHDLDDLVELAAQICGAPTAMISLIDENRQWYKAKVGIDVTETPRDISFCGHAVQQRDLFVIPDASLDERFADNPLVTGESHVRFYAGAQLVSPEDEAMGALCVIDHVPRKLTKAQQQALRVLARQVMTHLELSRHIGELKKSEKRFRLLVEQAVDAFFLHDDRGKFLDVNRRACDSLGYSREELLTMSVSDVTSCSEEEAKQIWDQLNSGTTVTVNDHHCRKDGSRFPVEIRVSSFEVDGQKLFLGLARDITERRQAELASLRLAAIVEFSDDAIIGKDLNSIITSWNRGAEKVFGYSAEEIVGTSIMRLIPSDRQDDEEKILSAIRLGESVEHFETKRQRKDGSLIDVSVTASPIKNAAGMVIGVSKVARNISERKRIEESLKLFRTLIDRSNDSIEVLDAETGRFLDVNETTCRRLGYSREELLSMSLLDVVDTGGEPLSIQGAVERTRESGFKIIETQQRRKDGSTFPVEVNVQYIALNRGYLLAVVRDITERKLAEDALHKERDFVSAVVDTVGSLVVVLDRRARIVRFNRACEQLTGYSFDEVKGKNLIDLVIMPEERTTTTAEFGNLCAGQFPNTYENHWVTKQGIPRVIAWSNTALVDAKGDVEFVIGTGSDITEKKQAQEQIAEQAAFLDKAQDAIMVRDLEGKLLFWNSGAERMYGWTRREVLGRDIGRLLYKHPAEFKEVYDQTIGQGEEWHGEFQHLTKNRGEISVEGRWTLIRDNIGMPKSVLAINTDITEKKKIEAQFMRAQRMESIGTLAGGIAHDLNNILAPIMMSIELLQETAQDSQSKEILETIELSARRGADIVRQVLSFARGMEGERIEIQPKHLVKDLEKIIKDTFPKDIRLRFIVPNDIWTMLGDPTQIHQILLNLCVNARDAMPNGGILSISVENCELDEQYAAMNIQAKPGRYIRLNVTDSGTGIPPQLVEKIFEPFFTTKDMTKGTGLGLSTVMAIVKSHEGIINVYSEPGQGTTFSVYLPALDIASGEAANIAAKTRLPRGNREMVLVVDDEASVLTITGQTLVAFGYQVLTATDGADAVAKYAQHRDEISVVITDMMMPVMDGPATIHALMRINPKIKIIAASGLNANGGVAKAHGEGIKHFLMKPYTASTLLTALRAILDEG